MEILTSIWYPYNNYNYIIILQRNSQVYKKALRVATIIIQKGPPTMVFELTRTNANLTSNPTNQTAEKKTREC